MNERLKFQGRLAEKKQQVQRLKLRMQGNVLSLRDLLDPHEPLEELNGELIADQALQLAAQQGELTALLSEMKAIEKSLS